MQNKLKQLKKLTEASAGNVDLESLLAACLEAFGGEKLLALELKRTYDASKESPLVRQKILLMIQQLVHAVTVHGLTKVRSASELTDEEIEAELQALVGTKFDDGAPQENLPEEARPADESADDVA